MDNISRQNAIKALKQTKMEIAGEYGMNYEDAFEIIENASNKGVLEGYFKKLEKKKI
ncbi:TPA: CD1290 family small acid-soluble spore protein [Clostridioides difficile]